MINHNRVSDDRCSFDDDDSHHRVLSSLDTDELLPSICWPVEILELISGCLSFDGDYDYQS